MIARDGGIVNDMIAQRLGGLDFLPLRVLLLQGVVDDIAQRDDGDSGRNVELA